MIAVVGAEDRAVRSDVDAVRAKGEVAFAPRALEVALLIVDDHGMVAAAHEINAVFAVHGDARHVLVDITFRQLLPAFDDGILILAMAPSR